jgi:hypothetical protein
MFVNKMFNCHNPQDTDANIGFAAEEFPDSAKPVDGEKYSVAMLIFRE